MKTYESLKDAIVGKTEEHAKAVGRSISTLNKWQEPCTDYTDSGALNPLDRVEIIIHTAVRLGKSKNPYAPLHYLAAACNHVAIPIPKSSGTLKELTSELLDAVREFGALAEEASKSMADGDLSSREVDKIEAQGNKACREIMEFVQKAKDSVSRRG